MVVVVVVVKVNVDVDVVVVVVVVDSLCWPGQDFHPWAEEAGICRRRLYDVCVCLVLS